MAKKTIKTARYWTRKCPSCDFEYPNWFTNCPRCHSPWNVASGSEQGGESKKPTLKPVNFPKEQSEPKPKKPADKTVRIIAQIGEGQVQELRLNFSIDNGATWFEMPMVLDPDGGYYYAEIEEVPLNSKIVYYLKGTDEAGHLFVEDNEKQFYYYEVYDDLAEAANTEDEQPQETPTSEATKDPEIVNEPENEYESEELNEIDEPVPISGPPDIADSEPKPPVSSGVTFTPLNKINKDKNLRECPNCHAKVKKDWSACPICGFLFNK